MLSWQSASATPNDCGSLIAVSMSCDHVFHPALSECCSARRVSSCGGDAGESAAAGIAAIVGVAPAGSGAASGVQRTATRARAALVTRPEPSALAAYTWITSGSARPPPRSGYDGLPSWEEKPCPIIGNGGSVWQIR